MIIGLVNSLELTPIAESMKKTDISNIKTVCSVKMRRQSTGSDEVCAEDMS